MCLVISTSAPENREVELQTKEGGNSLRYPRELFFILTHAHAYVFFIFFSLSKTLRRLDRESLAQSPQIFFCCFPSFFRESCAACGHRSTLCVSWSPILGEQPYSQTLFFIAKEFDVGFCCFCFAFFLCSLPPSLPSFNTFFAFLHFLFFVCMCGEFASR